jgi:hypothetical protein
VYPFIEAGKSQRRDIKPRLRAAEAVSRSAVYADRTAGPSKRQRRRAHRRIIAVRTESDGTYAATWVRAGLADQDRRHGRKRVARLTRFNLIELAQHPPSTLHIGPYQPAPWKP